jgi:hemerythrin-like domain-containing protein
MDAVSAITQDHRLLERLFRRVEQEREQRPQLIEEITARLSAHSVAEEIYVYPELEKKAPEEADEVHHGVSEHREAEEKLAVAQSAGEADFDQAFKDFVEAVGHHVEEEETELLPALQQALTPQRLEALGADFEQRRIAELEDWENPDT